MILCLWFPNWPVQRYRRMLRPVAASGPGSRTALPAGGGSGLSAAAPKQPAGEAAKPRLEVPFAKIEPQAVLPNPGFSQAGGVKQAVRPRRTDRMQTAPVELDAPPPADPPTGKDLAPSTGPQSLLLYAASKGALRTVACCRNARQAGVRLGMPLAEAMAIVGAGAVAVEHNAETDRQRLVELAIACRQFSPVCGIEQSERPSVLLLDIDGCGHLFGGEVRLAEAAIAFLMSEGYVAQAGIAPTVGLAWAASRAARRGVCELTAETGPVWIDRQPLAALRLPEPTVSGLAEFDLVRVGQVRRLPRTALPSRFGTELLKRLDQADGTAAEPIRPILPPELLRQTWETEHPLRKPDLVNLVLEDLVKRLVAGLPKGVGLTQLDVLLRSESRRLTIETRLARPSQAADRVFELLELKLERQPLPASIDWIEVEAGGLETLVQTQTDLFGNPLAGREQEETHRLLERLAGRLGTDAVRRAQPTGDPLPERSIAWTPALDGCDSQKSDSKTSGLMTRPLRLFDPPLALDVVSVGGRPARLTYRGRSYPVQNVWGPERIESGWWRDEGEQRRNYYRVELDAGGCWWIYSQPGAADWFLHGVFA